jgi:hypothetical protein
MNDDTFDPKKALQATKTIYISIISGCMVFLAVVFAISTEKFIFRTDFSEPLAIALLVLSLISFPAGIYFSGKLLSKVNHSDPLEKKYQAYQTSLIVKMASCEGVALLSLVYLMLSNNSFSLVFFVIAIGVMMRSYPTPEKIGKELNLSLSETELF